LKAIFKKIFSKNLKAVKPFDLVSIGSHPIDIEYSGFNGDIIEVPLQRCRSYILGFFTSRASFLRNITAVQSTKSCL
jgi:hypothetical protein